MPGTVWSGRGTGSEQTGKLVGMDEVPEVRFTKSDGIHLAYQVVGSGPVDVVFIPGALSHLELCWEETRTRQFLERLTAFSRLILFDKRGQGLSDREAEFTLEERVDDVRAIMDAAGSEQAVLLAFSEGGPIAVLFAGLFPERVGKLVLACTIPRAGPAPGFPCGPNSQVLMDEFRRLGETAWGEGKTIELFAPNLMHSERARKTFGRWERMSLSPGAVATWASLWDGLDVRDLLPALRTPTLVISRSDDLLATPCHGRYLAAHIPGARYVEVPGGNHILWSDADQVIDEIEQFVGGTPPSVHNDRVLATVLFTDIVNSTARAAAMGDRPWRGVLDSHDSVTASLVERFRGHLVKSTGDGILATFDGPGRAVRCADAIRETTADLGIDIRAGLHTGEIELRGEDIGGIAVHIAQRICGLAGPDQILVSSTIKDLVVGSGITFADAGVHQLRGVPDQWHLFTPAA